MRQVARVMISDAQPEVRSPKSEVRRTGCQPLTQISNLGAEAPAALGPRRILVQQTVVLLKRRAATGGIGDDRVKLLPLKSFYIAPGTGARGVQVASVREQRAAAALVPGNDDLISGAVQQPDAGRIGFAEHHAHHAATDEPDPAPRCPAGGRDLGK